MITPDAMHAIATDRQQDRRQGAATHRLRNLVRRATQAPAAPAAVVSVGGDGPIRTIRIDDGSGVREIHVALELTIPR